MIDSSKVWEQRYHEMIQETVRLLKQRDAIVEATVKLLRIIDRELDGFGLGSEGLPLRQEIYEVINHLESLK